MYFSKRLNNFNNIKHCFFSRENGFSKGIYSSMNCGLGSNDNKKIVEKNLRIVSTKMGVKRKDLILMNQTHSNKVVIINQNNIDKKIINSDAIITNIKGMALGVLTADCVPLILYDKTNNIIACVHAGWKGAITGIIKNTIEKIYEIKNSNEIIAAIGPCIGKKSYEVDLEFYKSFMKETKKNEIFFISKKNEKFNFNIRGYVKNKLNESGVNNIDNIEFDTFEENDKFYSYRRSIKLGEADYGRCISTICLKI
jgi:YfiH family protein